MAIVKFFVTIIVMSILYYRMTRRDVPTPIGKTQAIVPILLGIVSMVLSFGFFILFAWIMKQTGFSTTNLPLYVRSLFGAFLQAGLPEELAKLLMILLSLRLFKSKVTNVYEYILIGAAVGFGFTLFEEILYSSGASVIVRIIGVAVHSVINMLMAKHLGIAKNNKINQKGSVGLHYVLAIVVPVLIHTCYDACTSNNMYLNEDVVKGSKELLLFGFILGLAAFVFSIVLQVVVLLKVKKNAEAYCNMKTVQ